MERLNSSKKTIKNQSYENYWKCTLALTAFFDNQFSRTLAIIINHIDKYELYNKSDKELIKNLNSKRKRFNNDVVRNKELEETIMAVYPNDSPDGSSTRKQINTFIKLGFIKPYLKGYVPAAKEFIKYNISLEDKKRIFSDTVYQYSSFNSSQVNDDRERNQVKFIVQTLLNKSDKILTMDDIVGMMQIDIYNKNHVRERELLAHKNWAHTTKFIERKYNQVSHLFSVLRNMDLFETSGSKASFRMCLQENANEVLPIDGPTQRDKYRFALMKKSVHEESIKKYGRKVCWLTKEPSQGLVVSHIYSSADALRNWDYDAAYDPENALLLKPGDIDDYFDKNKITFNEEGKVKYTEVVREDFAEYIIDNNLELDECILTEKRKYYLKMHRKRTIDKFKNII